jgi:hypothetical protein
VPYRRIGIDDSIRAWNAPGSPGRAFFSISAAIAVSIGAGQIALTRMPCRRLRGNP